MMSLDTMDDSTTLETDSLFFLFSFFFFRLDNSFISLPESRIAHWIASSCCQIARNVVLSWSVDVLTPNTCDVD
jgi:hypothetical protein